MLRHFLDRAACAALFLAGIVAAGPAFAAGLPRPAAEYAASQAMTVAGATLEGRVHHSRGKERREMTLDGIPTVLIVRPDKGTAWLVEKDLNMAMRVDLADPDAGPDLTRLHELDATVEQPDPMAGLPTTRYRVKGRGRQGVEFDGRVWSTPDGIYAKVEGSVTVDGVPRPVLITLRDVQPGPQDPALFELPPGVQVMTLDPLQGRIPPAFKPGEGR